MVAAFSNPSTPSKSRQKNTSYGEENPTTTTKKHVLKDHDSTVARKTRAKQACSRYLSPSATPPAKTTTRFSSPLISRSTNTTATTPPSPLLPLLPNRSHSVDRRRTDGPVSKGNCVNAKESSAATKMSITPTRSLSVSFQREAFTLLVSKRKGQVSDHWENSNPVDLQWWLERTRKANLGLNSNPLSRSLDCNGGRKMFENNAMLLAKSLQRSMMLDESSRKVSLSFDFERKAKKSKDVNHVNEPSRVSCDPKRISKGRIEPRNIASPASLRLPESDTRLRLLDPGLTNLNRSKRFSRNGTMSSPVRGSTRPTRVSISVNSTSRVSPSVDVRRGDKVDDRLVGGHMLKLLYNHYLQWRFANAKADASFMIQKLSAEKKLRNVSVKTSELQNSVTVNRIKLLVLRQKLKLFTILKGQIAYLEAWDVIDNETSSSLLGATEALKASTLLLPIDKKALIDIRSLKDAVGSAVAVLQAMASSISLLSSKVEEMKFLIDQLMNVTANEKILVEQCTDILSRLAVIQVKECSLRAHLIQSNMCTNLCYSNSSLVPDTWHFEGSVHDHIRHTISKYV